MNNQTGTADTFEPTRWSLVLRSREEDSVVRRKALGELCAAYWYPLYAFLRRSGAQLCRRFLDRHVATLHAAQQPLQLGR